MTEEQKNPNIEATPQPPDNSNAGESKTPEVSKQEAPSRDEPRATASKPAKEPNHDQSGDTSVEKEKKPAAKKPAAKAKPPKPEDKPFPEFIEQEYIPTLEKALQKEGIEDLELEFAQKKLPAAFAQKDECWQVMGNWKKGQRKFNIYFLEADIKGQKAFSAATDASEASTLESFMIDERRVTLDLLILYTLQRLNAQKWLTRN